MNMTQSQFYTVLTVVGVAVLVFVTWKSLPISKQLKFEGSLRYGADAKAYESAGY